MELCVPFVCFKHLQVDEVRLFFSIFFILFPSVSHLRAPNALRSCFAARRALALATSAGTAPKRFCRESRRCKEFT